MRFRFPVACTLGAIFALLPARARADEPKLSLEPPLRPTQDLPPPGARLTHVVAGVAVTAVSYGLATGTSYLFPEWRGSKDLRIPIAGPWMALAQTGCPTNDPDCNAAPLVFGSILNVISGVTQLGGLAIIGEGLFLNTSSAARPAPKKAAAATLRAVPMDFGPGSAGLGFVGTF